jgi:starch synthase
LGTTPSEKLAAGPSRAAVCLLASEVQPLSKTGGLADVVGALAKYLHAAGLDVRTITPGYAGIDRDAFECAPLAGLAGIPLALGAERYVFSVLQTTLPGGAPAYLIDCPALFARATLYTSDPDEHLRFLAFTRAALITCQRLGWTPDVIHCNDWHTAFAPLYLRSLRSTEARFARTRTLLTLHNVGYQGIFPAARAPDIGLPDLGLLYQPDLAAGHVNALRQGILYADAVSTVSPTYAREICTADYGMGLEDSLRARAAAGALYGILNGVDYQEWDPRRDRYLPAHYDADSLAVKARLKREYLAARALAPSGDVPLAGMVTRLAAQKGIELMFEALPNILSARPLALTVLGSGEPQYERFFAGLVRDFPGRVAFQHGYDVEQSHWIEAASDTFLMPSRYEPSGLNQMYSQRYGTVPVVRRTGGLADSVEPYDPERGTGAGVVFDDFDAPALAWALNRTLDLYRQPGHWTRMMRNGMQRDFSWEHQVNEYIELYRRLGAA